MDSHTQGVLRNSVQSPQKASISNSVRSKVLQVIGVVLVATIAGLFLLFATDEARALFETLRNSIS
ncbi:MAG: hypothetical protein ACR2OW_04225 [Methyloligellaceae bacterium]